MPSVRNRVAERVQPSVWIENGAVAGSEDYSRSTNDRTYSSWTSDAQPNCTCRLIPSACDDRRSFHKSSQLRGRSGYSSTNVWRLKKVREPLLRDRRLVEHFTRPTPAGDVEQEGARSLRDINGEFTTQTIADVIFRQKKMLDTVPYLRLMAAYPEKLNQREVRKSGIASEPKQA